MKKEKGITLIALIITIIVLLILAGVSLKLIAGDGGIFGRAEKAVTKNDEASAREKLELELQGLIIAKKSGEEIDIDRELREKGFTVNGDTVIVDGYSFIIDRENLKIISFSSEGKENSEIKINVKAENSPNNLKSTISATIDYDGQIASVTIDGKKVQKENGIYSLEVSKNGKYTIYVKDNDNCYKMETVEVIGLLGYVDEIWNVAELIQFRDSVNNGLNYADRIVKLKVDLDLAEIENWEPIGYSIGEQEIKVFKGTFEGENHTINHLTMNLENTNEDYWGGGLFGTVNGGSIKNLKFENVKISSQRICTGTAIGIITGGTVENIQVLSGTITSLGDASDFGGVCGDVISNATISNCSNKATIDVGNFGGGIVGSLGATMRNCVNYGNVTVTGLAAGGLCGQAYIWTGNGAEKTLLENCYNKGKITGDGGYQIGGICGLVYDYAQNQENTDKLLVRNCYNNGEINSYSAATGLYTYGTTGGIVGELGMGGSVKNCYNLNKIKRTIAGKHVGGIIGLCQEYSEVSTCYNVGNIESDDSMLGGLCGLLNSPACYFHDSYISESVDVKYRDNLVDTEFGWYMNSSTEQAYGRLVGYYKAEYSYENIGQLEENQMPTVYDVLNEFKSTDSTIWDKSNPNEPKLLWE